MLHRALMISLLLGYALGFAQHPGAYSSPHYAKKNVHYSKPQHQPGPYSEPEYHKLATVERPNNNNNERSKHHEIDLDDEERQKPPVEFESIGSTNAIVEPPPVVNETQVSQGRSSGFMAMASNFLNGRGGQMLADIAREVIARSTGATSQVLSLNLTNLVILVVLKALILAAGMFGAGAWGHGYGRSLDDSNNSMWIEEKELAIWMGYLEGGDYSCLTRAACKNPTLAARYASGADLLLLGARTFQGAIPYDKNYETVVEQVKEAAKWGSSGMACEVKYNNCLIN